MEFNILGGVGKNKSGLWQAKIYLVTPDGKETALKSGFIYRNRKEAEVALQINLDRILTEFKKDGVEILSKDGVKYS